MEAHGPERGEPIRHASFLLLGGGLAAATAAETLRLEGAQGAIVIVAAERDPPYHRPQLSTRFLEGDSAPPLATVLAPDYFHDNGVSLLSGVSARAVDAAARQVRTDHAGTITYDKLLIATGVRPLHLQLPGAGLPGIHYLRTASDARTLRGAMEGARRAVVVGAGFIALELAAVFARKGFNSSHETYSYLSGLTQYEQVCVDHHCCWRAWVSASTLRRWDAVGKLVAIRTEGASAVTTLL